MVKEENIASYVSIIHHWILTLYVRVINDDKFIDLTAMPMSSEREIISEKLRELDLRIECQVFLITS